jgi:hypothetical protein
MSARINIAHSGDASLRLSMTDFWCGNVFVYEPLHIRPTLQPCRLFVDMSMLWCRHG